MMAGNSAWRAAKAGDHVSTNQVLPQPIGPFGRRGQRLARAASRIAHSGATGRSLGASPHAGDDLGMDELQGPCTPRRWSPTRRCMWVWIVPAMVRRKVMNPIEPVISQSDPMFST